MASKCNFCGSKELNPKTPYIDRLTKKHLTTFCCSARKINHNFAVKRYGRSEVDKDPSLVDRTNSM